MLFSRAFGLLAAPVSELDVDAGAARSSSHCGRICQQRAIHGPTLSSAAYGILDVMDAVPGAYDHCAGKAKHWCPQVINSTCHQIARELTVRIPAHKDLKGKAGFSVMVDNSQAAYEAGLGWAYKTFAGKDYGVAPTPDNARAFNKLKHTVNGLRKKNPVHIDWKTYGEHNATLLAPPVSTMHLQSRGDKGTAGGIAGGVVAGLLLFGGFVSRLTGGKPISA